MARSVIMNKIFKIEELEQTKDIAGRYSGAYPYAFTPADGSAAFRGYITSVEEIYDEEDIVYDYTLSVELFDTILKRRQNALQKCIKASELSAIVRLRIKIESGPANVTDKRIVYVGGVDSENLGNNTTTILIPARFVDYFVSDNQMVSVKVYSRNKNIESNGNDNDRSNKDKAFVGYIKGINEEGNLVISRYLIHSEIKMTISDVAVPATDISHIKACNIVLADYDPKFNTPAVVEKTETVEPPVETLAEGDVYTNAIG